MDLSGKILQKKYQLEYKIREDAFYQYYAAKNLQQEGKAVLLKLLSKKNYQIRLEDLIRYKKEVSNLLKINYSGMIGVYEIEETEESSVEENVNETVIENVVNETISNASA